MFTSTCSTVSVTSKTPEMHSRGCSHRCTSIRCAHTFSASHLRFSGSVCSLRGDVQRPPSPARHARLSSSSAVVRSYCSVTPLVPLPFLARASLPFVACALSHASPHQPSPPLSTTVLAEPQISPSLRSRRAQTSPSSSRLRCRRASSFASASSAPTRTLATTSCAIVC